MPRFQLETTGFPDATIPNGSSICNFTWAELVWAAVTVGKRELYDVVRHGQYSAFEIVFRCATLYANLKERQDGFITRSAVYRGLDPSEKAATSYFLGLAVGKLLAELCLDVPWLMHLDVYRDQVQAQLSGRSRPDLIGQDSHHRWIVLESKGRSGDWSETAYTQAKEQAQQIASIGGRTPHLCIGLLAYFDCETLMVQWQDPRPDAKAKIAIDVSDADVTDAYYRPFETLLRERTHDPLPIIVDDVPYESVTLPDADLRIGLRPDVRKTREERGAERIHRSSDRFTEGKDGIAVELGPSWSTQNMLVEPQERQRQVMVG
jgi:hypothetical protein